MRTSNWSEFLFTVIVRFLGGILLGGAAGFLADYRGILRGFSHNDFVGPLLWLGLFGFSGGLVAVFTMPRWQTPWYKREPWPAFDSVPVIKTADADGQEREYASVEEEPMEIQSAIADFEAKVAEGKARESVVAESTPTGFVLRRETELKTTVHRDRQWTITDASGAKRTYHSLDEMPPGIRAAIEASDRRSKT